GAGPAAGPDPDLGRTRPPARPGPGPRGRPEARRPAGRARPPARRAAPGMGAERVGRATAGARGAAGRLGTPRGHRGVLPGISRDHRPGAGDRPGALRASAAARVVPRLGAIPGTVRLAGPAAVLG